MIIIKITIIISITATAMSLLTFLSSYEPGIMPNTLHSLFYVMVLLMSSFVDGETEAQRS